MSLPTAEELMDDYNKIMQERDEEDRENRFYIDEDYDPADLTPRNLREPEPSEISEDELKEKLKKFKTLEELKGVLETFEGVRYRFCRENYKNGILEVYDSISG